MSVGRRTGVEGEIRVQYADAQKTLNKCADVEGRRAATPQVKVWEPVVQKVHEGVPAVQDDVQKDDEKVVFDVSVDDAGAEGTAGEDDGGRR